MRHFTIPIFIPEIACPNRCIFCNQQKISGALCQPTNQEVIDTIEVRLSTIAPGNIIEIGFFGGNFTGIGPELQESFLSVAQHYVDSGQVQGIRLSTRPDYINIESLRLLKRFSVTTIELGAQSLDADVLMLAGRGHTVEDVRIASQLILENGFQLGLQMMIGLPGDTLEKSVSTARQIVELGASCTRIYPTLVIKDTELETQHRNGQYVPLTLEDAVSWTKDIVKIFEAGGVKILRMGLHPSEGMLTGETLVAGPFHVAFGEMVRSAIWGEVLGEALSDRCETRSTECCEHGAESGAQSARGREQCERKDLQSARCLSRCTWIDEFQGEIINVDPIKFIGESKKMVTLIVEVPSGQLNAAIGHNAVNKKMILSHFHKLQFKGNSELKDREFRFYIS